MSIEINRFYLPLLSVLVILLALFPKLASLSVEVEVLLKTPLWLLSLSVVFVLLNIGFLGILGLSGLTSLLWGLIFYLAF